MSFDVMYVFCGGVMKKIRPKNLVDVRKNMFVTKILVQKFLAGRRCSIGKIIDLTTIFINLKIILGEFQMIQMGAQL